MSIDKHDGVTTAFSFTISGVSRIQLWVVGKNLKQEFYGSLDRHCPQLIQIFRSKRGLAGQILSDLLQQAKVCTFKLMPLFA